MKKIVIIGGVAGGASAATRLRRLDEKAKIIMFERGPHVSFSSCGLPYRLGNVIKETESLFVTTPKQFYNNFNIDARINEEVIEIDRKNNKVKVKKIETEEIYEETYDKLILSPGANPIVPKFPGIEKVQVFTVKTVVDVMNIIKFLNDKEVKEITIIGGGFIGVETAENLREIGYNITLIEAMPQILKPFDYDMVQIFHKELMDKGVNLILNKKVEGFEENKVLLSSGEKVKTDLVLMAIGVSPETTLAKNANLDIGKMGGIRTNQNYMTNDSDIYAIGDAIEVYSPLFHDYFKLALAGPAQKQGRAVADHINDLPVENRGFIGTSIIKVFDYNGASTGMTEGFIKAMNLNVDYDTVALVAHDSVSIMPNSNPMYFKLVYEIPTGKILG
ncbi:MAG: FAD-dependent oxidoreductase, partial [Fusobacterium sp. JB020]|nr:FAD-dependent oxidoreductase [Fusobacterium sp. JB020]